MARWTVQDGEQLFVIDVIKGAVSVAIQSDDGTFTTGADGVRDMRRKLGLAIGEAEAEPQGTS